MAERKLFKCVRDTDGIIIPWIPRASNIGDNSYHFEEATPEEIEKWKQEYEETGKCEHPCGYDTCAFYMEESVCGICGRSDMF